VELVDGPAHSSEAADPSQGKGQGKGQDQPQRSLTDF
jgi:hypothetical protein